MTPMIIRLAVMLTALTLAGCGLKGPLYFPSAQQQQTAALPASGNAAPATAAPALTK